MKKFFKAIGDFFKKLAYGPVKSTPVAEVPDSQKPVVSEPAVDKPAVVTKEIIKQMLAAEFAKIAGAVEKGSNTDKGGIIDTIITFAGGRIGWAYCALTVTYLILKVCIKLGISYPKGLYRGASSQGFKNSSLSKYVSSNYSEWCAFVHTNSDDPAHGHIGFGISPELDSKGNFKTAEGNFSNRVDYFVKNKSYVNKYVDIVQAIFDQYQLEHK